MFLRPRYISVYLLCLILFCPGTRAVATTALGNIWPLGDSITYGAGGTAGGYRDPLYSKLTAAGYTFTMVGNRTDNSTALLNTAGQARHEGYPGYTIANIVSSSFGGLYENVATWYSSISQPDIILLMIGINDLNHDYDIATAPDRLDLLITRLFTLCPEGRIIVASVLDAEDNPYRGGATNNLTASVSAYNAGMTAIVNQRRDLGQNISLVDMNAGLTLADLSDGLHPNSGGYTKMGDLWANAIMAIPPSFSTNGISVSGETVSLTATGAAGTSYSLWASTNLMLSPVMDTWTKLTNSTVTVSPFTITDQGAITNAQRFYLFCSP